MTEQASIDYPDGVTADELVAAVEATGYTATVHRSQHPTTTGTCAGSSCPPC